jgi:hypothetical protein
MHSNTNANDNPNHVLSTTAFLSRRLAHAGIFISSPVSVRNKNLIMICAFIGCVRGVGIMKESMDPSLR